jgi:hypothetical protein
MRKIPIENSCANGRHSVYFVSSCSSGVQVSTAFIPELAPADTMCPVEVCPSADDVFQLSLFDRQRSKSSVADRPKQMKYL